MLLKRLFLTFMLVMAALPVGGGVLGLDVLFSSLLVRQVQTLSWPSVTGTVTRSEVKSSDDSHDLQVQYTYTVEGQRYEGSQYRLEAKPSKDREYVARLAERFPAGASVPVYYRPDAPSEAVLLAEVQGLELGALLFLLPFNLAVAGLLGAGLGKIWEREALPRVFTREGCECMRLGGLSPALVACMVLGGTSLVLGTLGMAAMASRHPSLSDALTAWGAAIAAGVLAAWWAQARLESGHHDLRVDPRARTLSLPPVSQREERLDVPWSDIESICIETSASKRASSGNLTRHRVTLQLVPSRGRDRKAVVASLGGHQKKRAEALVDWLRARSGHAVTDA